MREAGLRIRAHEKEWQAGFKARREAARLRLQQASQEMAAEAAEIDALLGRATQAADREAELEAFVLEHGAEREAELLQFFQKRCLRQEALMQPVLRELEGSVTRLIP